MTHISVDGTGLSGVLRLTSVTDHLEHVLQHSQTDEPPGTWTGLACSSHGLTVGTDVNHDTLQHLAHGKIADLIWEAPADFTAEHTRLGHAAIRAYQTGDHETGEQLWQQVKALWTHAWSANHQAIALMQGAGLTQFSPDKPQQWLIASFEHHCGPHGLGHPHIHNIVLTALTTGSG